MHLKKHVKIGELLCSHFNIENGRKYTFLAYYALLFLFFKITYLFIFREKGREGEREGEKHQCVVASQAPSTGTWTATQAYALTGN